MPSQYEGSSEEKLALELFIKLMRATEAVFARNSGPVIEAGLTGTQFGVLETLYHLGALRPSQLAEKHLKSRNNLTVVIDHLERDGLVQRTRCPSDRRAQWIHLTETGRAKIQEVFPLFLTQLVHDLSVLNSEEKEILSSLLKKLGLANQAA